MLDKIGGWRDDLLKIANSIKSGIILINLPHTLATHMYEQCDVEASYHCTWTYTNIAKEGVFFDAHLEVINTHCPAIHHH
ncbi:hypothetical protein [Blastomonas aquatica]|uniref:Uncharacterized protein n=1 Tax=Blastomonas aquatica TaxID=1510276 RepID=A0ABQ1JRA6_9SPHN|nr:hypothetical protein [Blastomonas aquatica]GGB75591.1 hypothetical protein GCM10010833_33530 [Blastomonas aquatica]